MQRRLGQAEWGDIPKWGNGLTKGTGPRLGGEVRGLGTTRQKEAIVCIEQQGEMGTDKAA